MFKNLLTTLLISLTLIFATCSLTSAFVLFPATKILVNGKIFTSNPNADPEHPETAFVNALAIRNNLIQVAGTNEEALAKQGPDTQVIDLQGRTVVPGFNDAHMHMLPYIYHGMYINDPYQFIPNPGPGVPEMLGLIQTLDGMADPEQWFYGVVGEAFIEQGGADRFVLDQVAPTRPVCLYTWGGHYCVVNTAMMNAAGISELENDPFGGFYARVEGTGVVNGVLHEYAIYDFVRRLRSQQSDAEITAIYAALLQQYIQLGVTTVQDIPIGITSARNESLIRATGSPIRYRNIAFPYTVDEALHVHDGMGAVNPLDKIYSAGVKWICDGLLQERYACLTQDYYDSPGWNGYFSFGDDFDDVLLTNFYTPYLKRNQHIFHMVGDQTIDNLLNTMTANGYDLQWKLRRVEICHGDVIRPDQIPQIVNKGIVVMKFPSQFIQGIQMYTRLGPERFSTVQPLKSLVDAGAYVALCSDQLGGIGNPYLDILLAIAHPTNPSEAVDLGTAVVMHTLGGAYAEYQEVLKGSLLPGRLADLAVLSQDIFDPEVVQGPNFLNTTSVLTLIDGDVVYNADLL
jgi:hypothetical protein